MIHFIHIPRTGGTSIRKAMGLKGSADHRTASDLERQLDAETFNKMLTFTVIRNPYDRLVSYYCHYRASKETFDKFVNTITSEVPSGIMQPQVSRLLLRGALRVDRFLRFEYLAQDWAVFASSVGLPTMLDHLNASKRRDDWRSYYDEDLARKVANAYCEDFAKLGYSTGRNT